VIQITIPSAKFSKKTLLLKESMGIFERINAELMASKWLQIYYVESIRLCKLFINKPKVPEQIPK